MDSLPTGTTQSWIIVIALALSPTAVLLLSDLVGRVLRRAKDRDAKAPIPGLAETIDWFRGWKVAARLRRVDKPATINGPTRLPLGETASRPHPLCSELGRPRHRFGQKGGPWDASSISRSKSCRSFGA